MASPRVMDRKLVVLGAILIQLCLGAIYAWSVFTPPLSAQAAYEIAAIYGAPQLGIDDAALAALNERLSAPRAKINELAARLRGETEPAVQERLRAEREAAIEQINRVVSEVVPAARLEALRYGFRNTQTQAIFSAGLAAFALVMVVAGRMMPRFGPRRMAIAGGLVLGLGYLLAGLVGGKSFPALLVLVGIVGGTGIGLAYVVPIAVGVRWFPDKKGFITGVAVAGFGFGALIWMYLADSWGRLIATYGLSVTFAVYGSLFALLCLVGSIWMVFPPEGWKPAGWTPPLPKPGSASGQIDLPSGRMLVTPQFYMIFLCFVAGSGAGLMSIGLMKAFPMIALMDRGLEWQAASAAATFAMAVCFALANGIGRIAWGTISDLIGRRTSILVMMASQGVLMIAFPWLAGVPALLYLGATIIGFNFGGSLALFPAITADTFGTKYLAQNYPWVFLAYGVGGIAGPMLGGRLGDLGNYPLAFTLCGVLCLAAAGLIVMVRPPQVAVAAAEPEAVPAAA